MRTYSNNEETQQIDQWHAFCISPYKTKRGDRFIRSESWRCRETGGDAAYTHGGQIGARGWCVHGAELPDCTQRGQHSPDGACWRCRSCGGIVECSRRSRRCRSWNQQSWLTRGFFCVLLATRSEPLSIRANRIFRLVALKWSVGGSGNTTPADRPKIPIPAGHPGEKRKKVTFEKNDKMKASTAFSPPPANPLRRGTRSVTCIGSDGDARAPRAARFPHDRDESHVAARGAACRRRGSSRQPGRYAAIPCKKASAARPQKKLTKVPKLGVSSIFPARKSYLLE